MFQPSALLSPHSLTHTHTQLWSHDAICQVLEAIVEFGGQRPHRSVDQLIDQQLQLLLRQTHVETFLQTSHGARPVETWQLGACRRGWSQDALGPSVCVCVVVCECVRENTNLVA